MRRKLAELELEVDSSQGWVRDLVCDGKMLR